MTMKTKILICLGALLGIAAVKTQFELPLAKVTVRVLDEAQQPVAGANVTLGFKNHLTSEDIFVRGQTDADGQFTGEGGNGPAGLGGEITLDGYYRSGAPIPKFYEIDALNHWKPWNATYTTTLRSIGKPVALYAKILRKLEIPALGQQCGYDLEKGDWVAPWGKGQTADFIFKATRDYRDWFNFTVEAELKFAQSKDGLLRMSWAEAGKHSVFHWERSAPETGYVNAHLIRFINRDPRSGESSTLTFDPSEKDKGYFFRVHTMGKDGRIIAANYGKIIGDIGIEARETKTCLVYFTYYLNPTMLDRNLEWDTTKNLIPDLKLEETPREP